MEKLYLLCNAHLDPAWLWQKDEGRAAAISTFRVAADFCEEYDGFVFNHNESLLYEWVEQEEPALFARIKRLVGAGKWHIIGGTYLQADCNLPSGESMLRQIQVGQRYFQEKFGVMTDTAFHVDAFGHSRGLVQIFAKMGYRHYIFMRPYADPKNPEHDFIWEGFDGSRLCAHHLWGAYSSLIGDAANKIEQFIKSFPERKTGLLLWGIGNHGGGPSRIDMEKIKAIQEKYPEIEIVHSDAGSYFETIDWNALPVVAESQRPAMVGCYTSMYRVKKKHRELESRRAVCEKMMAHAGISDADGELLSAEKSLLFNEFHDILPGTAIRSAEEDALREMDYAAEIFERFTTRAFFKLCEGQRKTKAGEIPVLVYNPHPYPVEMDIAVEFQLENQNWTEGEYTIARVYDGEGNFLPTQHEKEECTLNLDWRKRIVFHAALAPMAMNRFDCTLAVMKNYPLIAPRDENDRAIVLRSDRAELHIGKNSGLIERFTVDGKDCLKPGSGKLCVFCDNEDPWAMETDSFTELKGAFSLSDAETAMAFVGCAPVEVIENGDVRTRVQAVFRYGFSFAVVTYTLSKFEAAPEVDITLFSNNRNVMVKYCLDTMLTDARLYGQTAFGTETLPLSHKEICYQQWCGLKSGDEGFYVLNRGNYGGSSNGSELRISLLRTPVYAAHPIEKRQLVPSGRFNEHIDLGRREFSLKLVTGAENPDWAAQLFNEGVRALSFFPSGDGALPAGLLTVSDSGILLTAIAGNAQAGYLFRLYNSSADARTFEVTYGGKSFSLSLGSFAVKRFRICGGVLTEEETIG